MAKQVHVINPIGSQQFSKLPVAAYCRVSSNSDDQRHSFAAQVKAYTAEIESNPEWALVGIYADEGITGTSAKKRPEFNRLMEDCRKGKIKRILVKSVSRFARNTKECLEYVRELKALGISVYFEDKKIDTAHFSSEMLLAMLGSVAQEESVSISNNMRWSYEKRMQAGEFITAHAPFGYYLHKGQLHINEDEAKTVQRIFALFLEGYSTRAIAEKLNCNAYHGAKEWKYTTILNMLKNEKYIGDALLHKRPYYGTDPYYKASPHGRQQYYVTNSHPAIIDLESFERAKSLLHGRTKRMGVQAPEHVLAKHVYCYQCNSIARRKKLPSGCINWVCVKHDQTKHNCSTLSVTEPAIESAFLRVFGLLHQSQSSLLRTLSHQLQKLQDMSVAGNTDINEMNKSIVSISNQIHGLNRLRAKGFMEPAAFQENLNALNAQLDAARSQRQSLIASQGEDQAIARTEELLEIIEHAPDGLASLEDGEVFSMMVDKVLIDKNKKIVFRLINGLELVGDGGLQDGEK